MYMRLESPCQPSSSGVTSMLTISPSLQRLAPGMPWHTTWLIEMQQRVRVAAVAERGGHRAGIHRHLAHDAVDLVGRERRGGPARVEHVEDLGSEAAGLAHAFEPVGPVQLDRAVAVDGHVGGDVLVFGHRARNVGRDALNCERVKASPEFSRDGPRRAPCGRRRGSPRRSLLHRARRRRGRRRA